MGLWLRIGEVGGAGAADGGVSGNAAATAGATSSLKSVSISCDNFPSPNEASSGWILGSKK